MVRNAMMVLVLLLSPMAWAQEKPAETPPQASAGISQEQVIQEFEKACAGFMEKFKACEPFACKLNMQTNQGVYEGTHTIKGKDGKEGCQFEMITTMSNLPPLIYRCTYAKKTHDVVFRVMEAQMKDPAYAISAEDRAVLETAAQKECTLEGEEAFVRALDVQRNEMMKQASEKAKEMIQKKKESPGKNGDE